jgi:excisionase family DNA binding protein
MDRSKFFSNYPDALNVEQAMKMLGVGRKTIYKLIENGDVFAVKPGKGFIISKLSLIKYLTGIKSKE